MSTRSLTRIFDGDREITCIYRHSDGYPEGMGLDLAKACDVRLVNGMSDDGLDQANGMGCLAARIIALVKVSWENPYEGTKMPGLEALASRKAPYVQPGNVSICAPGTQDCWEEYEYHVKDHAGQVVLSCYLVSGEGDTRRLTPLAVDVEPSKFLDACKAAGRENDSDEPVEV